MTPALITVLIICMILPPVTVAMFGKPLQVLLNIILTAFGIIPGLAHAIFVMIDSKANKKAKQIEET